MSQNQTAQKEPTAHIFLACLLLFGIPAGVCIYKGDLVTGIALATIGLSCYLGYRTGAARALVSIGGILAGVYLAPQWAPSVEPFLTEWFSVSGLLNRAISLSAVGLAIVVACYCVARLFCRFFLSKNNSADGLNRWGGLFIMGAEATVGIALLLGGILMIYPEQKELPVLEESANLRQRLNYQLNVVASTTRSGAIGTALKDHNPFVKFPQLNKFKEIQQTVRTISDPAKMKQIVTHPRIKDLQNNPSVQAAISKFEEDDSIQEILSGDEPLDSQKLMALLNSQVVMDLLDEPEFLDEATKIMEDLNQLKDESADSQTSM